MGRLRTQQAKDLWTKAIIQYVCAVVAYTLLYALFTFGFGLYILADFGDWVADQTSSWSYATVEEFDQLVREKDIRTEDLQIMEVPGGLIMDYQDWEAYGRDAHDVAAAAAGERYLGASSGSSMGENGEERLLEQDDQGATMVIAFRDLRVYNTLRDFKYLAVIMLYFLGLLLVSLLMLRRPIRYLDAVTDAISSPSLAKGEHIELPGGLESVQSELELLQMRIVQNEMAARIANERKNELVTYLAHDIRTPMTSVMGYLELIGEADGMSADRQREYAQRAYEKATRLNGLVEELFEITRYNMQSIPIEREDLDVQLLCQQIAEEFFPQAQERQISIDVEVGEGLKAFLDPSRMGRVLENVLKNAIAHASEGSTIVIAAQEVEGGESGLAISVSNKGKEISPEHLEHIFDRFYRGDAARGQRTGGAGLGLAIAKEIVEAHGGFIEAKSGQGNTTFTIRMPR